LPNGIHRQISVVSLFSDGQCLSFAAETTTIVPVT